MQALNTYARPVNNIGYKMEQQISPCVTEPIYGQRKRTEEVINEANEIC